MSKKTKEKNSLESRGRQGSKTGNPDSNQGGPLFKLTLEALYLASLLFISEVF